MVHRKADDLLRDAVGYGKVLPGRRLQAPVSRELADQGIEVPAAVDVPGFQLIIEFISCHAVLLRVHENGEVGVVVPYARHVLEVGNAWDIPKALAVRRGHPAAGLYGRVHLTEVEQAVCRTDLVHLAVDTGSDDGGLSCETEVLQVVDPLLGLPVVHHKRSALYRVVHLRGMKTQRRHVALVENATPVDFNPEGVGCVIDHFQPVFVRYLLYPLGIARLAVAVNRHDGRGPGGDGRLDAVGVDAAVRRVDVHEHRLDAVPPQRVGRRHEAEGGRYDLARDAQGLQRRYQRQGAVGEEADVGNLEVPAEGRLQFLVPVSVVGDPFTGPDVPKVCAELVQVRKERGRHGYLSVLHRLFLVSYKNSEYGVLDFNIFRQAERLAQTNYYRCSGAQLDN